MLAKLVRRGYETALRVPNGLNERPHLGKQRNIDGGLQISFDTTCLYPFKRYPDFFLLQAKGVYSPGFVNTYFKQLKPVFCLILAAHCDKINNV